MGQLVSVEAQGKMGGSRKAFSLILFLVICPLPGHPRPVPNIATPIVVSLTPLGAAALIGKGILKVGLLKTGAVGVATAGAASIGGLIGGVTSIINSSNNNNQKEEEDLNSRHQHRYYRGRQNRHYG